MTVRRGPRLQGTGIPRRCSRVVDGPRCVRLAAILGGLGIVAVSSIRPVYADTLSTWRAALERTCAGRGQARVAFFGDSHVASDGLSGGLRELLQRRCGDAGPGFVVPVAPTAFYARRHVGLVATGPWRRLRASPRHPVLGDYGLGGAAVEPAGPNSVATITSPAIDSLEVWTLGSVGGGTLEVRVDGGPAHAVPTAAPVQGAVFTSLPIEPGPHVVELRARRDGPVRVFGLALDRRGPGVRVDALGLDGARAQTLRFSAPDVLGAHLRHRAYDLVILAYGTNEIVSGRPPARALESDFTAAVGHVRRLAPDASCLLVGPTDVPFAREARRVAVLRAEERVAAAAGCAFFDTVRAQGGPGANARWAAASPPLALGDLVHLTDAGYARVAAALAQALGLREEP